MKAIIYTSTFFICFLQQPVFSQRVGIGTKQPQYFFTVRDSLGGGGKSLAVVSPDNSTAVGFYVSNGAAYLQTHTDNDLYFSTNDGSPKMTLQKSTGYVGIGVSSPIATLDVSSSTARTLNLTQNNTGLFSANIATVSSGTAALNVSAATGGYAARLTGQVIIDGSLTVTGSVSKAGGTFKIDHPLDPANKYLVHSFVESPDMMNVYNGNIVTGSNGIAVVKLPDYFESENIDFKYQLTVIGQFAQAIISKKISNNQFEIMTDKPAVEVSWQITGVRNDLFAQKNRVQPEEEKTADEKGFFVNPEVYNLPEERSISNVKGVEKKK